MKNYRVTVNGVTYDVQVEETNSSGGYSVPTAAPVQAAPAAQAAPAPAAAPATAAQGSGAGTKITAPMPGNILDIKVNVGDSVKENQVVIILEAMKMENEIISSVAGTVTGINVTKGQTVASGDTLLTVG